MVAEISLINLYFCPRNDNGLKAKIAQRRNEVLYFVTQTYHHF